METAKKKTNLNKNQSFSKEELAFIVASIKIAEAIQASIKSDS